MMRRRVIHAVASVALFVLSGCAGAGPASSGSQSSFDAETGSISGLVVDQQYLPVQALVSIDAGESVVADERGAFEFSFLAPGNHVVRASAAGYSETSVEVQVQEGKAAEVLLQVDQVGGESAFHETQAQSGLDGCSISYRIVHSNDYSLTNYSTFICFFLQFAGFEGLDRDLLLYDVGPLATNLTGFWGETTWTPTQILGREMRVVWAFSTNAELALYTPFEFDGGPNPVGIRMPIETLLEDLNVTASDACRPEGCTIGSVHYSGPTDYGVLPVGIGVQIQQRFDEYLTSFHNGPVPTVFTVLPDA